MRNIIYVIFVFLCFLFLSGCHNSKERIEKDIAQARAAIKKLDDLFQPVPMNFLKVDSVNLESLSNPFEARIITQSVSSLSDFLSKSWVLDGYVVHGDKNDVKQGVNYSSVFIRSGASVNANSAFLSTSGIMLLSIGNKLFDRQWIVHKLSPDGVVLFNPVLNTIVQKTFEPV